MNQAYKQLMWDKKKWINVETSTGVEWKREDDTLNTLSIYMYALVLIHPSNVIYHYYLFVQVNNSKGGIERTKFLLLMLVFFYHNTTDCSLWEEREKEEWKTYQQKEDWWIMHQMRVKAQHKKSCKIVGYHQKKF